MPSALALPADERSEQRDLARIRIELAGDDPARVSRRLDDRRHPSIDRRLELAPRRIDGRRLVRIPLRHDVAFRLAHPTHDAHQIDPLLSSRFDLDSINPLTNQRILMPCLDLVEDQKFPDHVPCEGVRRDANGQ